ncbi:MAG: 3-methyl-2-oxobutanoate hydroxymethyltransferase [Phenylobacterium zucineum]|nr:MAG: 3-methyl-2-oxobutanoate hydroxymethyltransferase [Phenylobacterium zucineum]
MRTTVADLQAMKRRGQKIPMLTAYDYTSALMADRAGLPMLLVGDSLGMVIQGHDTTLPVTVDDIVRHTQFVARGAPSALIVADMPFMSYATLEEAIANSRKLMAVGGAQAVKLEGGKPVLETVRRLTDLGVPVMGHLGFRPQSQHQIGLQVQGKDLAGAKALLAEALALEAAGAFAIVLELVPGALAAKVSANLTIPVIGIGAGADCDGQVQVWHDILGLYGDKPPRHAKRFADLGPVIDTALKAYVSEVRAMTFPTDQNTSRIEADILDQVGS